MRQRMLLLRVALALVVLAAPTASQAATQTLRLKAKVTHFQARGRTLTGNGVITGTLASGGKTTKDTARPSARPDLHHSTTSALG